MLESFPPSVSWSTYITPDSTHQLRFSMFAQLTSYIALCLQRSSKAFDFSHNDCVELIVCCQWRRMPDCSAGPKEKKNTNMNGRERTIDRRRWSMGESSDEQTWSMHFANSTINTSSSRHLSSIVVLIIIMDESIQYRSKSSASMELNRKDCCMIQSQLTSVEKRNTKRTHFHNVILCACLELYVWHRRNKIHSRTTKKAHKFAGYQFVWTHTSSNRIHSRHSER